jgi:hypothetical protein
MKPKQNRQGADSTTRPFDRCQTPAYAIEPLRPYLKPGWRIWEPASGDGMIVTTLQEWGHKVIAGDILKGSDFFQYDPGDDYNAQITNPPYSIKYRWLERCYNLGKPFALLLPVETLGAKSAQDLFVGYDVEVILLDKRVNFKMPNAGWKESSAQFPTCWITHGLNIGHQLTFAKLTKAPGATRIAELAAGQMDMFGGIS